ncbi:MAG: 2Fe-2S iron-sulfur cluster-binding protein [Bryobacteraceae bacterium]
MQLKLNGKLIEMRHGETILEAARRHGAHMWFLCDGRGICQTCECHVVSGGENLSAPTALERTGLRSDLQQQGHRLGCQARLTGAGPVSVVSRVEDLRRRARAVVSRSGARSFGPRLRDFAGDSFRATADLATGVAAASSHAVPQLIRYPPTPGRVWAYAVDTVRLLTKLWAEPSD